MANLFFPQLSTGATAQYPLKKSRVTRSITNLLADGSVVSLADPAAGKLIWQMSFNDLSPADMQALQAHFQACCGPFHAFTFLDPADNLLSCSADLTNAAWQKQPDIQIARGVQDPAGETGAFLLTNLGSAPQAVLQQLTVPANYQFCFSVYAASTTPEALVINRIGTVAAASTDCSVDSSWTRFVSSGTLNDSGTQLNVGVTLAPGQQISIFGPQLEAQVEPSRYRATSGSGGIYANAHWVSEILPVGSNAPNLFSTEFSIQTNL